MQFIYKNLGFRRAGDVAVVNLTTGANVRLMDSANFQAYKSGRQHRFHGGLAQRSPVRLPIPHAGNWYVAVDTRGLRNGTRASISVVPRSAFRPLPPIAEAHEQLQDIAGNLQEIGDGPDERSFDVFVSHATEDKEAVVRPLAQALQDLGVSVWYDEYELRIGDSLRRKIDHGIANSRFGIVVLSAPFFSKGWPQYELDGLVSMSVTGKQVILPLWHNVSKDDVMRQSPSLADRVALRTSDYTIAEIAEEIARVVLGGGSDDEEDYVA